ncbi:efflux RND transporter permease subunit [Candidatus Kaiserbacteria bacterium]|nr:efflux RND transporter permease subunit [Candidatus Kaiserbacteria bacterium]MCB9812424.1 efflux RND transporter permease subunit [Candidatus Nomurabacteria bacterium]
MSRRDVNIAGRISHFFAVNRPLSMLVLVVSLLFGLTSFFLTPKQYNPEITRPAFTVTIEYAGATTAAALDRVVYELVEKIDTVPGVDDIYTQVTDGATINTTVIFEVGYDATRAKVDLLSQLEQHSYLARGNINPPHVLEINPETIPILQVVFGSAELTLPELRSKVIALSHQLGVVVDVSELQVYGGYQPSLVVEVDLDALVHQQVSFTDLTSALRASQVRMVSDMVRSEPYQIEVVYDALATTPAEFGELIVAPGVALRDVAVVYEGYAGSRSYVFHESDAGRGEVVLLSVAKVEGASAPVVADTFLRALDHSLSQSEYDQLTYTVVSNDGTTAEVEIFGLTQNLLTSIAIVALVLLLFLSTRAALVVLVAIPVTLLLVFGLGLLFDQTINRITLFALILSLGLLVDSAIVATENIYSHLKRWQFEPNEQTKERVIATAVDEIGVGLLLSTITSVIVFLPMNFITGMMGPYMGPIAFFVPAALIISFLVAIVVTPFIASHLLHVADTPNRLTQTFSQLMDRLIRMYTSTLRKILYRERLQRIVLRSALFVFLVSLMLPMVGLVHFQMLPRADRDQFYAYVDLPVGTDRESTKDVAGAVSTRLLADRDVVSVQQFIATPPILDFNGMFKGAEARSGAHQATLRVNLVPAGERSRSSTDIATAVRAAVSTAMPDVAPAVRLIEEPPGPPVRATLVAKVSANEEVTQRTAASDLKTVLSEIAGVVDVYQSDDARVGRVRYEFDYVAAQALGVSPEQVATVLGVMGGSYEVGELLGATEVEYTPLMLKVPSSFTTSPNFIDALTVTGVSGESVPLRSVLTLAYEARPSAVYLEDAQELSYVTAEIEERSVVYVMIELMRHIIAGELDGYVVTSWNLWGMELMSPEGNVVALTWGGEWEMTLENFRDLGIAMGVALCMVYALLVAQYKKFSTPAYILVTVPLGLVGILWGFFLLDVGFNIYLTATALIGFIALIGIVVNNAIIYLEYVEQAKAAGASYREALIQAGEARLRPILLTSLTTVLGSLTIAGDPVWSGLAWAIVFGLSLSTVLTLVIYPTLLVRFVGGESN